jgi:hypothetical protein
MGLVQEDAVDEVAQLGTNELEEGKKHGLERARGQNVCTVTEQQRSKPRPRGCSRQGHED